MESVLPDYDADDGIDDEVETETGLGGGPSITQVMCAEDIPNQLTANATVPQAANCVSQSESNEGVSS